MSASTTANASAEGPANYNFTINGQVCTANSVQVNFDNPTPGQTPAPGEGGPGIGR